MSTDIEEELKVSREQEVRVRIRQVTLVGSRADVED
jgi:hypothetical protein